MLNEYDKIINSQWKSQISYLHYHDYSWSLRFTEYELMHSSEGSMYSGVDLAI